MAVVQDPTGAVFGLWQAGQHGGAQVANEPGSLSWNECVTSDAAAAADFYRAVCGYAVVVTTMAGVSYRVLQVDGRSVAGISQTDGAPHWATTFNVADTDATCARAEQLGARVLAQPTDLPEIGRYATLQDPVGATFGVIQDP